AAIEVPATVVAKNPQTDVTIESIGPKLVAALGRAKLAWTRPEIELRTRVEVGQGELWLALATPCSAAHEGALDAGVANVAVRALVLGTAKIDRGDLEPWAASSGIGLVVHAAALPQETPKELAPRLRA